MAFKYQGRSRKVEDVVRRGKESSGSYDSFLVPGISRYKAKEGDNQIRVLPPPDFGPKKKVTQKKFHDKWGTGWEVMGHLHRKVGPDEGTYLCPKAMLGKPCAVCEARVEADAEEADALRVQKRPFCWVIDRDNEKAGPLFWDMPMGVFRDINLRSVDKKTGALILIDDPEEGFDVMFTREGTDMRTKYTAVEIDRDTSPLQENERKMERWLDYINSHPIPDVLNFHDPDHVEKVLFGQAERKRKGDEEEEEEEEEAPRKKRRRDDDEEEEEVAPKKKRRDEPEEEEEEEEAPRKKKRRDEPEEEEEEEEEAPRKKRKRDEEEEEEDETPRRKKRRDDEEEEEEEEPPRKRKRDAEEEEEEEEPPRKKKRDRDEEEEEEEEPPRKKRKPARDEEEEEEGGEEGEEEEDEKPSRAAKRKLSRLKRKSRK